MRKESFGSKAPRCGGTGPLSYLAIGFAARRAPLLENDIMARFVFATGLAAVLGMLLLAMSYGGASAQERATCSQARAQCGTQRVCQRRFENCMQTGCWTVVMVKRCGYEKR